MSEMHGDLALGHAHCKDYHVPMRALRLVYGEL